VQSTGAPPVQGVCTQPPCLPTGPVHTADLQGDGCSNVVTRAAAWRTIELVQGYSQQRSRWVAQAAADDVSPDLADTRQAYRYDAALLWLESPSTRHDPI
jgi:hypothetical protein